MESIFDGSPVPASQDSAPARSALGFPVVGIGASAGGVNALLTLFEHMPANTGMAFVVILHLSPKHESHIDAILQRVTRMPVVQVNETMPIQADHIYVIPPTKQLKMDDSHLELEDLQRPLGGRHVTVDQFFRTLALAHRDRSIGVLLSGTGSDGSLGLAALKEHGGVTMAQSPHDAEYPDMVKSAIATGRIDMVLPVVDMPQRLMDLWENARRIQLPDAQALDLHARPPDESEAEANEEALREIMALLRIRTGNDFRHYKRATVLRRIERRLQVNALPHLPAYREFLSAHAEETHALLQDMLISVTNFFRDREAFEAMERELVQQLFEQRTPPEQVRVWVTGCATGEEAYSMAMVLMEHAAELPKPPDIQLFATDIDERAIGTARSGLYPEGIVTDVPPTRLRQFFQKEGGQYRIKKAVRERILFAHHNILRDPPFSRVDVVCCRNLLIYLEREVQLHVLEMFHFALNPGGLLFLGSSESADVASKFFTVVDKKNRIYRANPALRGVRQMPLLGNGSPLPRLQALVNTAGAGASRRVPFEQLHQRLIEQYAPPSVLVDQQYTIVHMTERAGRFLRHVGGTPSFNLLTLVLPEIRPELRSALFHARQSGQSVEARRLQIERNGRTYYLNMTVRPVTDEVGHMPLLLVLFDEVEATLASEPPSAEGGKDPVVVQLEQELQKMAEQLQGSIGESEVSNEELRASNEELQAINEELRSATEELETSKEELQSVNEELITANYELKNKVEETSKINDDLQNLIASTDIATVFIDSAMRIKRYTPRAVEVFNMIATDVGRSLMDITHRLDYPSLADDAAEAFETLRQIEREVKGHDGRWFLVRLSPYRTTENRIEGAVLNFIDITARRCAEEKLRSREERLRLVAESTKDYAIITLDADGCVTTWNQGAERMFGYAEAEMLGQSTARIFLPEDVARGAHEQEMRTAREQGRAEDERWHQRKDGSRLYCSGIVTPMFNGDLHGYAKIARDLTDQQIDQHRREEQLLSEQHMRTELEAANAMKDEFLAVMSHELKNPLNLIQLNTELMSRLPEVSAAPAAQRAVDIIRRTVRSQAQIIDDLLDLSRMHTGKLALNRTPVELVPVVQRIADAVSPDAQAKHITVSIAAPEANISVYADLIRVEQVVWNLVSNALKFTPQSGRVVLKVSVEGGEARLDVADTGQGIEPTFLEYVFDMFRQENARTTRSQGGLGIGLALVKHLTEIHGGRVEVFSEGAGRGSRFTVWLPLFRGGPSGLPAQAVSGRGLEGVRLLMVDDAVDSLEAFSELLKTEGAVVGAAASGREALAQLEIGPFDVLMSDIAMPEMDGYELIGLIRQDPRFHKLPAIAVTGFGRVSDAQRALASGFDAHIGKPIVLTELVDTVLRLVPKRP